MKHGPFMPGQPVPISPALQFFIDFPTMLALSDKEIAKRCGSDEKLVKLARMQFTGKGGGYLTLLGKAHNNIHKAARIGDTRLHYCPDCRHIIGWKHWMLYHECTRNEQLHGGFRFWTGIPDEYLQDIAENVPGTLWDLLEVPA